MLARLRFYFKTFFTTYNQDGFASTYERILDFLKRRRGGFSLLFESIDYHVLSRFRYPLKSIINVRYFDQPKDTCKKWALYSSFHPDSIITDHVIAQLTSLKRAGYSTVFLNSSPKVSDNQWSQLKEFCLIAVHRRNLGHDFGSWVTGFKLIRDNLSNSDSIILMNDSCYGPYHDIFSLVHKELEKSNGTIIAMSKSYLIEEHLQSYFLLFGKDLISHSVFSDYMQRIRILKTKNGIVRYFEIGGSSFLKSKGIRLKALVDPVDDPIHKIMSYYNSHDPIKDPVGKALVERGLTPFYKRSNGAPLDRPLFLN